MRHRVSVANGRGSQRHNRRDFFAENVDKSRTKDNIVLVDRPLKEAYKEAFAEAIEEYNKGQKQKCRQLTVEKYMEKIEQGQGKENNPKLFYETIIQVGDMDTAGIKDNPKTAEEMKKVLVDYFKDFQKRTNGHLVITGAYIHMDEATPHMHIDWIPTARGYKKGMQVRNSLEKAMGQMGHVIKGEKTKRINNRAMWQEYERNRLCEVAKTHGIEAYWEKHGTPELSVDVPTYKKLARMSDRKLGQTAEVVQEQAAAKVREIENANSLSLAASILASTGKQDLVNAYSDIETANLLREEQYKAKQDSEKADNDREKARLRATAEAQAKRSSEQDSRDKAFQEEKEAFYKKQAEDNQRQAMRDAELTAKDQEASRKLNEVQRVRDDNARILSEISTEKTAIQAEKEENWDVLQETIKERQSIEKKSQELDEKQRLFNADKEKWKPVKEANKQIEIEKELRKQETERADNNEHFFRKYRNLYENEQRARVTDKESMRKEFTQKEYAWIQERKRLLARAETAEAQNKAYEEIIKSKDQASQLDKNTIDGLNNYVNILRNENYEKDAVLDTVELTIPEQARLRAYSNQSEEARAKTTHGEKFPAIDPTPEQIKAIERQLSKPKGIKHHQSHGRDTGR